MMIRPEHDVKLLTPDYETTMTSSMTTKKTSALASRGLDSFKLFQAKEFVSGYQNLVTIQPLNKSKVRGWFVRKSDLDTCGWTATEDEFANGSVIWNYKQTFGMAPNTSIEEGLNFTEPRVQILLRSPLMVEETTGKRSKPCLKMTRLHPTLLTARARCTSVSTVYVQSTLYIS